MARGTCCSFLNIDLIGADGSVDNFESHGMSNYFAVFVPEASEKTLLKQQNLPDSFFDWQPGLLSSDKTDEKTEMLTSEKVARRQKFLTSRSQTICLLRAPPADSFFDF